MLRLKELRRQKKLNQTQFARAFGVAQNTVSNWENGNRTLDAATANEIADFFGVSVDYLLGRDVPSPTYANALKPSKEGSKWIPVLGTVVAGIPLEAVEDIIDYEEISPKMAAQGEFFALQIKGDSMEPKMSKGDVVIVRAQNDCDNGDVAIVLVNGDEATIKRIKKGPEGLMLIPNNPAYEPIYYSNAEIESLPVRVIGKVVELRAKF